MINRILLLLQITPFYALGKEKCAPFLERIKVFTYLPAIGNVALLRTSAKLSVSGVRLSR